VGQTVILWPAKPHVRKGVTNRSFVIFNYSPIFIFSVSVVIYPLTIRIILKLRLKNTPNTFSAFFIAFPIILISGNRKSNFRRRIPRI
jgi:hypothetical protein